MADIDVADLESALNVAASKGSLTSVSYLLCKGATKLACAIELSSQMEHYDVAALLILCQAALDGDVDMVRSMYEGSGGANANANPDSLKAKIVTSMQRKHPPAEVIVKVAVDAKQNSIVYHLLRRLNYCDSSQGVVSWTNLYLAHVDPTWLAEMSSWVRYLDLSHNHLAKLSPNPFDLPKLVRLDLAHNRLVDVPDELFRLPNICYLDLSNNRLKKLPGKATWSSGLQKLFLSHNKLAELPENIQQLRLEVLKIDHNCFVQFPQCVCCLSTLKFLDIGHNPHLTSLPRSLGHLTGLEQLGLDSLDVDNVPNKTRRQGTKEVIQYLRAKLRSSKESYHVKVILLGPPSKSKARLVARLTGDPLAGPRRKQSELTITEWTYSTRLWSKKISFSIWDFYGVEEYLTTHYCFLNTHAVCLVVFDLTSEASELSTWLDSIAAHAPHSTVVFVAHNFDSVSEMQLEDRLVQRVRARIRQKLIEPSYKSLTFGGLSVMTDDFEGGKQNVQKLRELLYRATMEHFERHDDAVLRRMVPASYDQLAKKVLHHRQILIDQNRCPILKRDELFRLVSDLPGNDIDTSAELELAINFLRQMGIILHYDIPSESLKNLVFIDPSWLFSIMARVIRSRGSNVGIMFKQDFSYLYALHRFPKEYHPAVLRLLNQFAVAVIVGDGYYLIPSLLPPLPRKWSSPTGSEEIEYQRDYQFAHVPSTFWSRLLARLVLAVNDIATTLSGKDQVLFTVTPQPKASLESWSSIDSSGYVHIEADDVALRSKESPKVKSALRSQERNLMSLRGDPHWFSNVQDAAAAPSIEEENSVWKSDDIPSSDFNDVEAAAAAKTKETKRSESGIEFHYSRYGMTYVDGDTHFRVVGNIGEGRNAGKVMSVMTSLNASGRKAMAMLADVIGNLIKEWYPQLLSNQSDVFVQQTIRCLQCMRFGYENVNNFTLEACAEAALNGGRIACHQHINEDTLLRELVPEFFLVDLPASSILAYVNLDVETTSSGRGANANVFKATYGDRFVACKQYIHLSGSPVRKFAKFRKEVSFLRRVDHPNILQIVGVCLHPLALVTEWAVHGTLQPYIRQPRVRLPRLLLYSCARQIADALSYLHEKLVVFRGLTPAKILVTSLQLSDETNVKLADFGKTGIESPSGLRGMEGYECYMAPEIIRYDGEEEYDSSVDVFSLAMLFYEMVTSQAPFSSEGACKSCSLVVQKRRPKFNDYSIPDGGMFYMSELMKLCWEDDPDRRPKPHQIASHLITPQCQTVLGYQALPDSDFVRVILPVVEEKEIWIFTDCDDVKGGGVCGIVVDALTLAVKAKLGKLNCSPQCAAVVGGTTVWIGDVNRNAIIIYDAHEKVFHHEFVVQSAVLSLAVSGSTVFAGLADGVLAAYQEAELFIPERAKAINVGQEPILSLVTVANEVWCCCERNVLVCDTTDLTSIATCRSDDTVTGMVVSPDQKTVWTMHRKLALLTLWDVATHSLLYSFDCFRPSPSPPPVSRPGKRRMTAATPFGLAGDKVSTILPVLDTLWVGTKQGYILVFSASDASHLTQFEPHVPEKIRCLVELGLPGPAGTEEAVVISGGSGFSVNPLKETEDCILKTSAGPGGVVLLWEAVPANDVKAMESKLQKYQES